MTQIQLTSIPTQIVHLSSLQYLDLSNNLIQGAIPSTLGTLSALSYLDISSNQLTGQIPNELTQCKSLKLLHLQSNQLNGTLPLFPTALEIHVDGNLLTNLGANNDKFITAGYNCLPKQGPFLRNVNCPVSLGDATVSAVSASSSPPVGAIVGGVIGGLVFVAAVVVVVLFARKSRREETRGSSMMLQPIQTYDSVYSVEAEDDEKSPILPAPPYFNPDEAPVAYYQNDSKSSVAASVSDSSREAGPLPSKDNGYIVHQ
ncbi:hypothetical protein BC830DRAFT_1166495 [Chytriomyces sp. MP71]|nr:hypothetical protein BC830DRAFT_1166495 [Chytriomyces sp. MP71]